MQQSEFLLLCSQWLFLPFGLGAGKGGGKAATLAARAAFEEGSAGASNFKTRVLLSEDGARKLSDFDSHCRSAFGRLPGCEEMTWVAALKREPEGSDALNVKVVLVGSAYETPTQFKLRAPEGFISGQGLGFYQDQIMGRGSFKEGHARLVLRPRIYVMSDKRLAGIYYAVTHAALWSASSSAELDIDAVFPSEDLLLNPPTSS